MEKTRQKRTFDRGNAIVVMTIVLCFMLALGLCFFLDGGGFLQVFAESDATTYYAVAEGPYDNLTLARGTADIIKHKGGAGYVYKNDGKYSVILSLYHSRSQAENVFQNLDADGTYVVEFAVPALTLKWCASAQKENVSNALEYYDLCFDYLTSTADSLAALSLTLDEAKVQNDVIKARLRDIKSVFYQKFDDDDDERVTAIKLALVTADALLDNIDFGSTKAKAVSCLRYASVQITLTHIALLNTFS